MTEKLNIAVVGCGFVGKAVAHGFRSNNVILIDPVLSTSTETLKQTYSELDAIFIAVPTPMGENGAINAGIVESVLDELSVFDCIKVLKSTVTPEIVDRLASTYKRFIYNPEFLTERNAYWDFCNPPMHVIGTHDLQAGRYLEYLYFNASHCALGVPVKFMTPKEASFVKYSINSYLATKVLFWNQMKDLIDLHGADYSVVRGAFTLDPRIGESHSMVPGHDGRAGAAGPCFAKDIPALIQFSEKKLSILRESWNVNCDIRNVYDDVLDREREQHIKFEKL